MSLSPESRSECRPDGSEAVTDVAPPVAGRLGRTPAKHWQRLVVLGQLIADVHAMLGPHRGIVYLAGLAAVLFALSEGALVIMVVPFLSSLMGTTEELHGIFRWIKELYAGAGANLSVLTALFSIIVLALVRQILFGVLQHLKVMAARRVVQHARRQIVQSMLATSFAYLDEFKSGRMRQVVASETRTLQPISQNLVSLIGFALTALFIIAMLIHLSPLLTAIFLCLSTLLVPLKLHYTRLVHRLAARHTAANLHYMEQMSETLSGVRQIKLLNLVPRITGSLDRISVSAERDAERYNLIVAWEPVFLQIFFIFAILFLFFLQRSLPLGGLDHLVAYVFMLYRLGPTLASLNSAINAVVVRRPSVLHLKHYLEVGRRNSERTGGASLDPRSIREIALEGVGLSYGRGRAALGDVSLVARRGEIVAVVGESGAGKSSLVHLLLGMYAPTAGRIAIDGRPIDEISLESLRECISIASQDPFLFDTTIAEIIDGGRNLTHDEMVDAARHADADAFIRELPDQYDTVIGPRGARLSGGQRQRLMLAQTFARRTPIVILDEATNALDPLTEGRVLTALDRVRSECIALIVTHRLQNLTNADRIYVLDQGRVVESGTWAELQARQGLFHRMAAGERREARKHGSPDRGTAPAAASSDRAAP